MGQTEGGRRRFTRAALRLLTQLDTALLRLVLHVHLVFAAHPAHRAPGRHDTSLKRFGQMAASRGVCLVTAEPTSFAMPRVRR